MAVFVNDRFARLLHRGYKGGRVVALQLALEKAVKGGFHVDGIFGQDTQDALIQFQLDHGLHADAVVGRKTAIELESFAEEKGVDLGMPLLFTGEVEDVLKALRQPKPPFMASDMYEMIEVFGSPFVDGWKDAYTKMITVNVPKISDKPVRMSVHRYAEPFIRSALKKVELLVKANRSRGFVTYDGCGNIRKKRGDDEWSVHSWFCAFDFDLLLNPLGAVPKMSKEIVEAFETTGFEWGGRWKRRPDGMHMQLVTGY